MEFFSGISAVAKTIIADDFEHGVSTLLQVAGVGPLQPNTVMVGWSEDPLREALFTRTVRRILELQKNLVVFAGAKDIPGALQPRIDVWWRGKENGSFMLTLAHLLQTSTRWRDHTIRLLRIEADEAGRSATEGAMRELLDDARIQAKLEIVVSKEPRLELIGSMSRSSEVVFIGLAFESLIEKEDPLEDYSPVVTALKGNVFLAKSWHDLSQ